MLSQRADAGQFFVDADRSQLTRSPLRKLLKGWTKVWTEGWTASPPLRPEQPPPHLGFQVAYDPDYPPPTYVTSEGCG